MKKVVGLGIGIVSLLLWPPPVFADSSGDVLAALDGMKQQMAKMQQTIDQQNLRIQQLESKIILEKPQVNAPLKPTTAPEGEAIPWLKGAKYGGDFRLRYEAFDFYDRNGDAGSVTGANDRTRNRFRIRLRWGFEKDYGDDWKMGFRLATGSSTEPTAENQTLGNSGYFNYKSIQIDKAYASYEPGVLKDRGLLKSVKVGAGKFENPFLRYSTPIVWDPDVMPEGVYEQVNLAFISNETNKLNLYATAGQFITNENAAVSTDSEIYGYQGALTLSTRGFGTETPVDITGAVSYYDYPGWSQTVVSNTASTSYLRTNTIVADNFRVLDVYPEIEFYIHRIPMTLWADYATNVGNTLSTEDIAQSLGNDIHDQDDAWGVGARIGKPKKKGDWQLSYGYYEIGANAVVAAFNDSDFGGPGAVGATNRKGHKFGFSYQLTDSVAVSWTGYVVRPLNPSAVVASSTNESVFRSQVDLSYKF